MRQSAASPGRPASQATLLASPEGRDHVEISHRLVPVDRRQPSRPAQRRRRPIAEARPVRAVAIERPAEGEIVSLTGQVRARDQVEPRLSPRWTDARAARPRGRRARGGTGRRPAGPADPAERAHRRASQSPVGPGGHDAGASRPSRGSRSSSRTAGPPAPNSTTRSRRLLNAEGQVESAQAQMRIAEEQQSYTS